MAAAAVVWCLVAQGPDVVKERHAGGDGALMNRQGELR